MIRRITTKKYRIPESDTILTKPGIIFTGPNKAGKTTRLDAIRLALLGYVPGYPKPPSATMENALDEKMSVSVTVDDRIITRKFSGSIKKASLKSEITPDGIDSKEVDYWINQNYRIPPELFDIDAFFDLSEQEQRKSFLAMSDSGWTIEQASEAVGIPLYGNPESAVLAFLAESKEAINSFNAKIKALKDSIKKLTERLAEIDSTTGNIADKKAERERIKAQLKATIEANATEKARKPKAELLRENEAAIIEHTRIMNETMERIENGKKVLSGKKATVKTQETELKSLIDSMDNFQKQQQKYEADLNRLTQYNLTDPSTMPVGTDCVTCGNPITPETVKRATANLETNKTVLETIRSGLEMIGRMIAQKNKAAQTLRNELSETYRTIGQYESKIEELNQTVDTEMKTLERLNSEHQDIVIMDDTVKSIEFADEQIKTLESQIAALDTVIETMQQKKEVMTSIDNEKASIEANEAELKTTIQADERAQMVLREMIAASVDNFLVPANDVLRLCDFPDAGIALIDPETMKEVFRFGKQHNDYVVPFRRLSGGEKIVYSAAFQVAVIANKKPGLPVIFAEDLQDLAGDNRKLFIGMIDTLLKKGIIKNFFGAATDCEVEGTEFVEVGNL